MNMMKKFVSTLSLALGVLAVPFAAQADGDIVDIRCVDTMSRKFGGETGRNKMAWGELCRADNPLVAGETLCIRVRMLVRNAVAVEASSGMLAPQTWQFCDKVTGLPVSDPGTSVKLGLMIGEKPAYADYSPVGLNTWEFSGELKYDDEGNSTLLYRYYTDFYFTYTVKAGDMGLPIRLMNKDLTTASATRSTTDYAFYGVNVGIQSYELKSAVGNAAGRGAVMLAQSARNAAICEAAVRSMMPVDLASEPEFAKRFAVNMYLP